MDRTKAPHHALLDKRAVSPKGQGVFGLQQHDQTTRSSPPPQKSKPVPNGVTPAIRYDRAVSSEEEENGTGPSAMDVRGHFLSAFSGSSSSSGDEPISDIVITDVYRDPLDQCMEAIEDLATGILRTGRLTLQGQPGDMTKLQPILMGLQPTEKELPQTLIQLLQTPFFNPVDDDIQLNHCFPHTSEDFLASGHLRLGLPIDTMIFFLLRTHCAKGAKQAEELIKIAQNSSHSISSPRSRAPHMPPIIFSSILSRPHPPKQFPIPYKSFDTMDDLHENAFANGVSEETSSEEPPRMSKPEARRADKSSGSSVSTSYSTTELDKERSRDSSHTSIYSSSVSGSSLHDSVNEASQFDLATSPKMAGKQIQQMRKEHRGRKVSTVQPPSRSRTSSSDCSGEELGSSFGSERRVRRWMPDHWHMSVVDNSTIVSTYGDNTYPILMWSPHLRVDFKLSSSIGLISAMLTGIDPAKPTVTMKVVNSTPHRISFSIRAYQQSTTFSSQVAYPAQGMSVLEQYQCWEENAEFYPKTPNTNEYFIIDLLVCTLGDGKPAWNVMRKYAVMRAKRKSLHTRRPSKRSSHLQLPGNMEKKEDNLSQAIAHGLQCVVKNKLDEAEIIFTQALQLPEFQRVPLKAFVYICLAVVANKRRKAGQLTSLIPVLSFESNASQLLHVCESPPGGVKMPRMVQLVKQLKKELNVPDIMKKTVKKDKLPHRDKQQQENEMIGPEGGILSHQGTTLTIPPGALKNSVSVALSKPDKKRLDTILQSTGWDKTVTILTVLHIQCNGTTDHFEEPVEVTCSLPTEPTVGSLSLVRLLKSNYLRQWQDITDDTNSRVSITGKEVSISTDHTGWLAVTVLQLDPSKIAQLAMCTLSNEPIMLQFNVYGQMFPDNVIQIAVFMLPCRANEEPIHSHNQKPERHSPIAFPHTVQAWPGERLRLELKGKFAPDTSSAETDLCYELEVQRTHNRICEKWVKLTSKVGQPLCGKLIISSCRNSEGIWESITEVLLSTRTGYTSSPSSSSDN